MLIRSRAPLRLGLAGGGTDVSPYCDQFGGAILNATIDYYAYAALQPLDTNRIEFESADLHESAAYPAQVELENDGRLDLFKAVYNHVVRNFNGGKAPAWMCLQVPALAPLPRWLWRCWQRIRNG